MWWGGRGGEREGRGGEGGKRRGGVGRGGEERGDGITHQPSVQTHSPEVQCVTLQLWAGPGGSYPQQAVTVGSSPECLVMCNLTTSSAHVG